METLKKQRMYGMSILLMLSLVMLLLPSMAHADRPMTKVAIETKDNGTQVLNSEYKFLVNGKRNKTGPLDGINCTAEFVVATGTLRLSNFEGKSISTNEDKGQRDGIDLKIELFGMNKLDQVAGSNKEVIGISNMYGGDINISSQTKAYLRINMISSKYSAYGISCGDRKYDSKIVISGEADVDINVSNIWTNNIDFDYDLANGIRLRGNPSGLLKISDNASLDIFAQGRKAVGIASSCGMEIDTDNKIDIKSNGKDSGGAFLFSNNQFIKLKKAKSFTYRDQKNIGHPKVEYDKSKFVVEDSFLDAGLGYYLSTKVRTYRYGNPFTMVVNKGSGSGRYLVDDTVTIKADEPIPNTKFKEWEGTPNLVFLEGTTRKSSTAILKMPNKYVELTATYEETLFTKQPMGGGYAAMGVGIPFTWAVSYEGDQPIWVILEKKNGEKWEEVWKYQGEYFASGNHTTVPSDYVKRDSAGSETYRLRYRFLLSPTWRDFYSKEFTMKWLDSGVKNVAISPATAIVERGKYQQFTAVVDAYGLDSSQVGVNWTLAGSVGFGTRTNINGGGKLYVDPNEEAKTLTLTATSRFDPTKSAYAIVNIADENLPPMPKYILNVVNGYIDKVNDSTVEGVKQSGEYQEGTKIEIKPDPRKPDKEFDRWVSTDGVVGGDMDESDDPLTLTMPGKNVVVTAIHNNPTLSEKLTGTVVISGKYEKDETITAKVKDSNNTGDLKYTWRIGNSIISGPFNSLFLEESEYFGQVVICEVTNDTQSGSILCIGGIIGKNTPDPIMGLSPVSPTVYGGNDGKITGTYTSFEYTDNLSSNYWKDCGFGNTTGLKAGIYYVRQKAGAYNYPGKPTIIRIRQPGVSEAALTGTVSINGERKFGETLSVTVNGSNNTGIFEYEWEKVGDNTSNSYIVNTLLLGKDRIGKDLNCVVTSSVETGEISELSGIIAKADAPAAPKDLVPVKPTSLQGTNGKITGTRSGMEYADNINFNNAQDCQKIETIELEAGTYYVRFKETETHKVGETATVIIPAQTEVELALTAMSIAYRLIPEIMGVSEGIDTNFIDVLNNISGMSELGVVLTLDASRHENIADDGTITYGDTVVDELITVKISKGIGNWYTREIMVLVPKKVSMATVSGYASWSKQNENSGITVIAKQGEDIIDRTTTDESGLFQLELTSGSYDIVISRDGYIQREILGIVVTEGSSINLANIDNPISLLAGDINGNGNINANDLSVLLAAFNKTTSDAGYSEAADLNGDGSINANDLSMLLSNFNKTASDYPEWILP